MLFLNKQRRQPSTREIEERLNHVTERFLPIYSIKRIEHPTRTPKRGLIEFKIIVKLFDGYVETRPKSYASRMEAQHDIDILKRAAARTWGVAV
jgi:hypothetical protein